jgi:hypothetical protein
VFRIYGTYQPTEEVGSKITVRVFIYKPTGWSTAQQDNCSCLRVVIFWIMRLWGYINVCFVVPPGDP